MEQNFQDRLKNFQFPPPDGAWNRIEDVLEAQREKKLARKLFYFEVMPPTQVWQKLSFRIGKDKSTGTPKKPIKKYLVYASIAASIILSIVSVNLMTGNNSTETEESLITKPKLEKPSSEQTNPKPNTITVIDNSRNLIAAVHPTVKKNGSQHKFSLKNIEEHLIGSTSSLQKFIPESASRNQEISYEDGLDKYMIYASNDGNAVRLPKKMYDNIACPSNDPSCREKIKLLQQKMAQGSFASDFTGVLDLLSNMDDRK
jgi:hypothetical protein